MSAFDLHPAPSHSSSSRLVRWGSLLLMACLTALPALAQEPVDELPGYVSLEDLETVMEAPAVLSVNIEGQLLKLVAESSRIDDPEFADLLLKLSAIQVRGFAMSPGQFDIMEERSMIIAERVERAGWETVVHLRQDGQYVDMYALTQADQEHIDGLMMLVVDQDRQETVIINIAGEIDPAELGRIGSKFNIAPLQDL